MQFLLISTRAKEGENFHISQPLQNACFAFQMNKLFPVTSYSKGTRGKFPSITVLIPCPSLSSLSLCPFLILLSSEESSGTFHQPLLSPHRAVLSSSAESSVHPHPSLSGSQPISGPGHQGIPVGPCPACSPLGLGLCYLTALFSGRAGSLCLASLISLPAGTKCSFS